MDQQHWTPYQDNSASAASRQSRYAPQPSASHPNSAPLSPQDHYLATPMSSRSTHLRDDMTYSDRDGDIKMEDADPYKPKIASPHLSHGSHQRMPSSVQQEESAAARRYSPMNLSPASPFPQQQQQQPPQQQQQQYTSYTPSGSSRASPVRNSYVPSNSSYYASPPS
jgi:dual specificity protein kinase YAK1